MQINYLLSFLELHKDNPDAHVVFMTDWNGKIKVYIYDTKGACLGVRADIGWSYGEPETARSIVGS